jgi:esterase/lipase superfamily enzyme
MSTPVGLRSGFLAAAIACAAGCAGGPRIEPLMPTPLLYTELGFSPLDHVVEEQQWNPRRVYYATTRQRDADLQRIDYTNEESEVVSLGLSLIDFGGPQVSWADLSSYSRVAERPAPVELFIAGLVEAGRFPVTRELGAADDVTGGTGWWIGDLNASIDAASCKDLLIYVHGAKVNFYNANAVAAQLDHFTGRDLTSMAFSWPTRQDILSYGLGGDVDRGYRAADALASLLALLARDSAAARIHVVAWSAGGRVVNAALKRLHDRLPEDVGDARRHCRIGTVYFAAADVPGGEFLDALPALNAVAERVVVTVTSNDSALVMAETFMGGDRRIG